MRVSQLSTPALLIDAEVLDANLRRIAQALPGQARSARSEPKASEGRCRAKRVRLRPRLRPHVKAHKCSALARRQAAQGHRSFTCATLRELEGLAAAGLGDDLLLANEVLDARRAAALDARVTLAIDSPETLEAAARAGVREVLIDVNVGLPRCGCAPERAGALADAARRRGLRVRGVMGYEGHAMLQVDRAERVRLTAESMQRLAAAHREVGGDVISAGGTGSYDLNELATEIQAGSYALMDTSYAALALPFEPALSVLATVISVSAAYAVADCGLKALGMDHGNPAIRGARVWFCSDEHITFDGLRVGVGERIRVWPAHVDPTVAYHERVHVVAADEVLETWPIDLRGW